MNTDINVSLRRIGLFYPLFFRDIDISFPCHDNLISELLQLVPDFEGNFQINRLFIHTGFGAARVFAAMPGIYKNNRNRIFFYKCLHLCQIKLYRVA